MKHSLLSPRARRVVLVVTALSAVATIIALLYGKKLQGLTPGIHDSYGNGPIGHRALAETLIHLGRTVAQNRGARFEGTSSPMWFIEPAPTGRAGGFEHRLEDALDARRHLPTVVVLPKWSLIPSSTDTSEAVLDTASATAVAEIVLAGATLKTTETIGRQPLSGTLGEFEIHVPHLQVFVSLGTYDEVLLDGPEGAIVVRSPSGVIVLSDPDILHSYNLHRSDHAALAVALLDRSLASGSPPDTVVFDEVFHGHGVTYSLGEALGNPPAVLLIVHLVLVALALFAAGSTRFGPPVDVVTPHRGPKEAIAISASILADGQRPGELVLEYVHEILLHTHDALQAEKGSGLTIDEAAKRLDGSAKRRSQTPRAVRLLAAARARAHETQPSEQLRTLAREVHRFRQELIASPTIPQP